MNVARNSARACRGRSLVESCDDERINVKRVLFLARGICHQEPVGQKCHACDTPITFYSSFGRRMYVQIQAVCQIIIVDDIEESDVQICVDSAEYFKNSCEFDEKEVLSCSFRK